MWFEPSEHNTLRPRENLVVLFKLVLSELFLFFNPCEVASIQAFYSLRSDSYNKFQGMTCDLGAGKILCCRAQQLEVANDVLYGVSSVESSCLIALLY
jgi:hypothetical protein